ncbi:hypothetical protein AML91_24285 [Paenibacillus jilunlii]|uniref:Uncharacterized protein n=1 Tax=Paenibacillus jilunlii TaxID=682956 RepID=A0ABR5SNT7_9BACL|nr:hypothetical protein AML91_24285 [Paenibacillus jilunlii]
MNAELLIGNVSAGYIAGFTWYLLDFMTKGKMTGHFYQFGLLGHEWDNDKWLLAGLSLVLALICVSLLPFYNFPRNSIHNPPRPFTSEATFPKKRYTMISFSPHFHRGGSIT